MITTENKSHNFMRIGIRVFVFLFILFVLISWIGTPVFAQTPTLTTTSKDLFNGEYELYKVPKGQTLSGVALKYNTTIDVLKLLNPSLETKGLQADAYIKVPKAGSTIKTTTYTSTTNTSKTTTAAGVTSIPIYHIVASGETLYALSKQFSVSVQQIKDWNSMTNDNLQAGAKVIIGYNGTAPVPKPVTQSTVTPTDNSTKPTTTIVNTNVQTTSTSNTTNTTTSTTPSVNTKPTTSSKKLSVTETGMASFSSTSEKLLLALHPTAPVGTYITVKNPANDKSIQVKVIGRLPETEMNENVSIQLSTFAAAQLGISDQMSTVQLSYLTAMQ